METSFSRNLKIHNAYTLLGTHTKKGPLKTEKKQSPFKRGWNVGISCSFMTSGSLLTFREDCVPGATTTMSSIFARCLAGDGDAGKNKARKDKKQSN